MQVGERARGLTLLPLLWPLLSVSDQDPVIGLIFSVASRPCASVLTVLFTRPSVIGHTSQLFV